MNAWGNMEKEEHDRTQNEGCGLWQGVGEYEAHTAVVLGCVFARLSAAELWRCGGVCRAWRRAAADRALWRRALLPRARPRALRALDETQSASEHKGREWSWRAEYALQAARWRRCGRLASGAGAAPLQCAALRSDDACLALVDEDSTVTIWEHTRSVDREDAGKEWAVRWSGAASDAWCGVAQAQWAPRARRLLLAGRLPLVERYEILVLHFDEEWRGRVCCRGASGPGGAACWVRDDAFLAPRLRLLAPRRACTTLWLCAATQEIHSEFAAVATPLLRIYNEAAAHISHILVAEVPSEEATDSQTRTNEDDDEFHSEPTAPYFAALRPIKTSADKQRKLLIAAGGVAGGPRGQAQALLAWELPALELPALWVEDELEQRVRARRSRPRAPDVEPDAAVAEDDVRALCTAPAAACRLRARVLGLVLHPSGGCVWATTETGAWCVSVPALAPLLHLPLAAPAPALSPHYLLPCVDDDYFVTPAGGGSGRVCVWSARGGLRGAELPHARPAAAAFLPRRQQHAPRRLLVLTADALHIVRSLTGGTEGGARRGSCTPAPAPPCAPCASAPRPACRARSPARPRGVRVVCCAPRAARRPPCAAPHPPAPLTCTNNPNRGKRSAKCSDELKGDCGAPLDRVAMRLAAAERVRRLDYEREVAERAPPPAPVAEPYKLAGEHKCLRAIDGRDYTVSEPQNATNRCSSNREPPPPCPIDLKPSDACEISRGQHLDPCEHQPRVFLEIDRSSNTRSSASEKQCNDMTETSKTPPKPSSSAGRFTTRILESLKRSGNSVCARKSTSEKTITRTVDDSWCTNLPPPKRVPVSCKEQSLTERLRQRPGGKSGKHCNPQRNMHTKTSNTPCSYRTSAVLEEKTKQDKSKSSWHERAELKEAGQGRVVPAHQKEKKNRKMGAGGLELNVPPNTEAVRVRVSLDFKAVDTNECCKTPIIVDDKSSRTLSSCHSSGGSNSWLSIKNLQKKFSRKKDTSTEVKTQDNDGNSARPNGTKKTIPEKQSDCSVGHRNKQSNDAASSSNTPISQRPCPPSPCTPRTQEPKSRFVSTRDFLVVI